MKPRLLDLFCGAGGAAVGYARAGFEVVGVDINPQPNYPFEFWQYDALLYDLLPLGEFDARHASPPCQFYSAMSACRPGLADDYAALVETVRSLLSRDGVPYVIENVVGAPLASSSDLFGRHGVLLCGQMFGLELYRHRLFETSVPVASPHHPPSSPCEQSGTLEAGDDHQRVRQLHPNREGPRGDGDRLDDTRRTRRGDPSRVHGVHRPAAAGSRSGGCGVIVLSAPTHRHGDAGCTLRPAIGRVVCSGECASPPGGASASCAPLRGSMAPRQNTHNGGTTMTPRGAKRPTQRYACYAEQWHRPHVWNVIGEDWWCHGNRDLLGLRIWLLWRVWQVRRLFRAARSSTEGR